ncbi:MAG: hypothetical protein K6U03_06815, partial [Firmicutes bacterium]|nr:hypothetical protein [Bacillota bacterium]
MNPRRAWLLGGIAFCLVAAQAALGPSLSGLLRRAIEGRATELAALEVRVAPVNWLDLFSGRIRRVEIQARQISFGGPRFALLAMDLREISLSPRAVFLHGEAAVRAPALPLGRTLRAALAHPGFVVMSVAFFACGFQLMFITTHLPRFLGLCGLAPAVGAQALAVIGVCNAFGSYFFGRLGQS